MKLRVPVIAIRWKSVEIGSSSKPAGRQKKTRQQTRSWLNKKLGAALVLVLILVTIGVISWHNLSSPSYGKVAIVKADTTPTTKLPEYTTLSTNFYSINYSERYHQKPTDIPPAGVLDQKVLTYKLGGQPGNSTVEINIKSAPYGGVTEDSAYIYYQKHPDQFKLSNKLYGGEVVDIAKSAKGQPEIAAIWLHGSYIMNIKITTDDKDQNIEQELKDLLSSTQWRE